MKTRQGTRKQEERQEAAGSPRKLLKRQQAQFICKDNVIWRNDLIIDPVARKIKLEPEESGSPVVKQEAEELQQEVTSDIGMFEEDVVSNMDTEGQASTSAAVTPPPPTVSTSISAQCRAELLQIRNETLENENEKLRALLGRKDAENGSLIEKITDLGGSLLRETESSGALQLELAKMEKVLKEKELEIRQLKEGLPPPSSDSPNDEEAITAAPLVLTSEEKVSQLFPEVLKIIIQNEARIDDHCVHWRKLLPLLTPCRLVCKSWKDSVDLIMQQDPTHLDIVRIERFRPYLREDYMPFPFQLSYRKFDDAQWAAKLEVIRRYLQENPNYNPIPSRHLVIMTRAFIDYGSENWTNFCKMVKQCLLLIGQQVWYLSVDYEGERGNYDDTFQDCVISYGCLSQWFSLVPNVRSIALTTLTDAQDGWRQALEKIPFPLLKYLETMIFRCSLDTHLNYVILDKNSHIKRLHLCPKQASSWSPVSMGVHLPNLRKLVCKFSSVDDWKQFTNVATWKLEDLSVEFYGCGRPTAAEFAEGVAKFGSTLKSLTFELTEVGSGTGQDLELNLPQLKSLQLNMGYWEDVKLEPLLVSLENLETFSVELSARRGIFVPNMYRDKNTFLDFVNSFRDIVDWKRVAKLQNVKLTVRVNLTEFGNRDVFVVRRENMPSVRFSLVKISADQIKRGGLCCG